MTRTNYEMTEGNLATILTACKPVPAIMLQCGTPQTQQERANGAWAELGRRMGFDHMTVKPSSGGDRFFTAVSLEGRTAEARSYYEEALRRVATTPEPEGQKFPCGTRVLIADDLGNPMSHFPSGVGATVHHTYAHAFGGKDVTSYCLDVDGAGETAWYHEHQISLEGRPDRRLT